jgi:hypothetical protein
MLGFELKHSEYKYTTEKIFEAFNISASRGFVVVAIPGEPKTRPFRFSLSHLCLFEGASQYGADCL